MDRESKEKFMRLALRLAQKAEGRTSPNPLVGAVVVHRDRVMGEGYHKKAGSAHAETVALKKAGKKASGGELFINLEPCCHFGRTPPCVDAVIASGIRKVYIGMKDPNPLVSGKGIRALRRAGIAVETGILRQECEKLNEVFIKFIATGFPFVVLKSALTLDGKTATCRGESRWISNPQSREKVHALRDRVDAILVGAGTVVKDNPHLTARPVGRKGKNPVRIILDNQNRVPLGARVFLNSDTEKVIYVASQNLPEKKERALLKKGVEVLRLAKKNDRIPLKKLMAQLGKREITSVLIEGGSEVNGGALREKIVDKMILFMAPMIFGGKEAPGLTGGLGIPRIQDAVKINELQVRRLGEDLWLEGYPS